MGLIPMQGSAGAPIQTPVPTENEYIAGAVPVTKSTAETLIDDGPVKNTFVYENVLDFGRFKGVANEIRQYIEGTPITVTYYRKIVSDELQTDSTDINTDSISPTYHRIVNFELRISDAFKYAYLTEENVSKYSGSGTLYPGFTPQIGDFFLYTIESGMIGQFKITSVNRLSIRTATCHAVEFDLYAFVDQNDINTFEQQVIKVFYFDIRAYLGGNSTLLKSQDRVLIDDIDRISKLLTSFYAEQFYSPTLFTFVRPDGVYDPYIMKFINLTIPFNAFNNVYPQELLRTPNDYRFSYWAALWDTGSVAATSLLTNYKVETWVSEGRAARLNALLNKDYVVLCADDDPDALPYISEGLVSLDDEEQSTFDRIVRMYYEQNQIDPIALLTQAKDYQTLEPMDQFYRIPVFMILLSLLQRMILVGRGFLKFGDALVYVPTEYDFTAQNLNGQVLAVVMSNKALGVIDSTGEQWMFRDGEVQYTDGTIFCDLSRIFVDYPGEWLFKVDATTYTASWSAGERTITVASASGIEVGMAVEAVSGIQSKSKVESIDGNVITIDKDTEVLADGVDVEIKIGHPTFADTWTLVLTGNIKASE